LTLLLAQRDPLYREVADVIISTDRHSVSFIIKCLLERLRAQPGPL
jgi:hypothetical protein